MIKIFLYISTVLGQVLIDHDWSQSIKTQCAETQDAVPPYEDWDTFFTTWWVAPKVSEGIHFIILLSSTSDTVCNQLRSTLGEGSFSRRIGIF